MRFDPEAGEIPFAGFSMGDAATPTLLDAERLQKYGQIILRDKPVYRLFMWSYPPGGKDNKFCFIGRHDDVARVLENRESAGEPGRPEFSVRQYRDNGRRITRGSDFVIGTEAFGPTATTRTRLTRHSGQGLVRACEGTPAP